MAPIFDEGGTRVCFIQSEPVERRPPDLRRDKVQVQITHRPKENLLHVASFSTGYTYWDDTGVEVQIGRQKFKLFTASGSSWNQNAEEDLAMVRAMTKSQSMIVRGLSSTGTVVADRYSLTGFVAAHTAINRACRVEFG